MHETQDGSVHDDADVTIDTTTMSPEEAANEFIIELEKLGYIDVNGER